MSGNVTVLNIISTHTSLAGRDMYLTNGGMHDDQFLLTRPSRDVTIVRYRSETDRVISTHTSLAGRDDVIASANDSPARFLLTRPSRDVTTMYLP